MAEPRREALPLLDGGQGADPGPIEDLDVAVGLVFRFLDVLAPAEADGHGESEQGYEIVDLQVRTQIPVFVAVTLAGLAVQAVEFRIALRPVEVHLDHVRHVEAQRDPLGKTHLAFDPFQAHVVHVEHAGDVGVGVVDNTEVVGLDASQVRMTDDAHVVGRARFGVVDGRADRVLQRFLGIGQFGHVDTQMLPPQRCVRLGKAVADLVVVERVGADAEKQIDVVETRVGIVPVPGEAVVEGVVVAARRDQLAGPDHVIGPEIAKIEHQGLFQFRYPVDHPNRQIGRRLVIRVFLVVDLADEETLVGIRFSQQLFRGGEPDTLTFPAAAQEAQFRQLQVHRFGSAGLGVLVPDADMGHGVNIGRGAAAGGPGLLDIAQPDPVLAPGRAVELLDDVGLVRILLGDVDQRRVLGQIDGDGEVAAVAILHRVAVDVLVVFAVVGLGAVDARERIGGAPVLGAVNVVAGHAIEAHVFLVGEHTVAIGVLELPGTDLQIALVVLGPEEILAEVAEVDVQRTTTIQDILLVVVEPEFHELALGQIQADAAEAAHDAAPVRRLPAVGAGFHEQVQGLLGLVALAVLQLRVQIESLHAFLGQEPAGLDAVLGREGEQVVAVHRRAGPGPADPGQGDQVRGVDTLEILEVGVALGVGIGQADGQLAVELQAALTLAVASAQEVRHVGQEVGLEGVVQGHVADHGTARLLPELGLLADDLVRFVEPGGGQLTLLAEIVAHVQAQQIALTAPEERRVLIVDRDLAVGGQAGRRVALELDLAEHVVDLVVHVAGQGTAVQDHRLGALLDIRHTQVERTRGGGALDDELELAVLGVEVRRGFPVVQRSHDRLSLGVEQDR